MIRDTVSFLKDQGKEVIFDAEHFFDGYRANPDYALECLKAAAEAGADCLVLCDTNGGTFPSDISKIVSQITEELYIPLGIHCHNDTDLAVANSIMAVESGAVMYRAPSTVSVKDVETPTYVPS